MVRIIASLPAGSRITDYISLGVVARFFPREKVDAVLEETGRSSARERDLPARVVVYYVIALQREPGQLPRIEAQNEQLQSAAAKPPTHPPHRHFESNRNCSVNGSGGWRSTRPPFGGHRAACANTRAGPSYQLPNLRAVAPSRSAGTATKSAFLPSDVSRSGCARRAWPRVVGEQGWATNRGRASDPAWSLGLVDLAPPMRAATVIRIRRIGQPVEQRRIPLQRLGAETAQCAAASGSVVETRPFHRQNQNVIPKLRKPGQPAATQAGWPES